MIGKIIEYKRNGVVYHIRVEEVTKDYIFGAYSFRANGYSKVMDRGLFEIRPGDKIEVLDLTELREIDG